MHPPSNRASGASLQDQLRPGAPAAHGERSLPLLPSGPGGVREAAAARDPAINTVQATRHPETTTLGWGFSLAEADCEYRTPLAPHLA